MSDSTEQLPSPDRVVILDVGHAYTTVVYDGGTVTLIDAPPRDRLLRHLEAEDVQTIDRFLVTQSDGDHLAGASTILLNYAIKALYVNPQASSDSRGWRHFSLAVQDARARRLTDVLTSLTSSYPGVIPGNSFHIEVLAPSPETLLLSPSGPRARHPSTVIRISHHGVGQVLLAPTIDRWSLDQLLDADAKRSLESRVLVFPHHGTGRRTEDTVEFAYDLCAAVKPERVVFSFSRSHQALSPDARIMEGILAARPNVHIACTQLSRRCDAKSVSPDQPCAGSTVLSLEAGEVVLYPRTTEHLRFIQQFVSSPACVPEHELSVPHPETTEPLSISDSLNENSSVSEPAQTERRVFISGSGLSPQFAQELASHLSSADFAPILVSGLSESALASRHSLAEALDHTNAVVLLVAPGHGPEAEELEWRAILEWSWSHPMSPLMSVVFPGGTLPAFLENFRSMAVDNDPRSWPPFCQQIVAFLQAENAATADSSSFVDPLATIDTELPVVALSYSNDGSQIGVATRERARLYDASTGHPLASLRLPPAAQLVTVGSTGVIALAQGSEMILYNFRRADSIRVHCGSAIGALAVAPDGRAVLSGGADGLVRGWDTRTGDLLFVLHAGVESILALSVSRDATLVATSTAGGTVHLWDYGSGEAVGRYNDPDSVGAVAISPDNLFLATAPMSGSVVVWNLLTGERLSQVSKGVAIRAISFSSRGRYLAACDHVGKAKLWEFLKGQAIASISPESHVTSVSFSPIDPLLATGGRDASLQIWATPREERLRQRLQLIESAAKELSTPLPVLRSAAEALERDLAITEGTLGPEDPEVGYLAQELGLLKRRLGEYESAAALLERALAINEATRVEESPVIALNLYNLALVHLELGNGREAKSFLSRAFAMLDATDPYAPAIAAVGYNLGLLERRDGELASARDALRRALTVGEKALGPDNPLVAQYAYELAVTEGMLGNQFEAAPLLQRAYAIALRALGAENEVTVTYKAAIERALAAADSSEAPMNRG